jgi:hypothetical protein
MGKGKGPIKGYNYHNWNANFDSITWSETKTIDQWVECLGIEMVIADWDFVSPRDVKISLKSFLSELTYCTMYDVTYAFKLNEFFEKDPDFVTCAECGQPRKWSKLKEMRLQDGEFVCKSCNFN